jgi:hypothetical protein
MPVVIVMGSCAQNAVRGSLERRIEVKRVLVFDMKGK